MRRCGCPRRYTAQITMRLHTLPLLALLVISAHHATSLPRHALAVTDLEKKLTKVVEEALKKDVKTENLSSGQELAEEVNTVLDIDNQLKKVPGIPVKVVEEVITPTQNSEYGIEKGEYIDGAGANVASSIKRDEVDLKHPGEPQRQEHDTQTPQDSNLEQDTITAIKQSLAETQNHFKQGFEGLATKFKGVFESNDQLVTIQKSLEELQKSFSRQFELINNNIKNFFSVEKPDGDSDPKKEASVQETKKKVGDLGEKVDHEVKRLNEAVSASSVLRASPFHRQENSTGGFNLFAGFQQYFTESVATMQSYLTQFQQTVQNALNQNSTSAPPNAGSQADEATTQRPTIWGGFQSSFNQIFRPPGQQQQPQGNVQADAPAAPSTAAPNRPIVQAIQSNPIYQGVVSLIRPTTTNAPVAVEKEKPAQAADKPVAEGSNAVPIAAPVESKPEKDDKTPTQTVVPSAGPIQEMVQKNPIVQGISSAVQRIQNTITQNVDKPRDGEDRGFLPVHGLGSHGGHGGKSTMF